MMEGRDSTSTFPLLANACSVADQSSLASRTKLPCVSVDRPKRFCSVAVRPTLAAVPMFVTSELLTALVVVLGAVPLVAVVAEVAVLVPVVAGMGFLRLKV